MNRSFFLLNGQAEPHLLKAQMMIMMMKAHCVYLLSVGRPFHKEKGEDRVEQIVKIFFFNIYLSVNSSSPPLTRTRQEKGKNRFEDLNTQTEKLCYKPKLYLFSYLFNTLIPKASFK
jgi:hypothetical protein